MRSGNPSRRCSITIKGEIPPSVPAYPLRLDPRTGTLAMVSSPPEMVRQLLALARDLDGLPGWPALRDPCDALAHVTGHDADQDPVSTVASAIGDLLNGCGLHTTTEMDPSQPAPSETGRIIIRGQRLGEDWELHLLLRRGRTRLLLEAVEQRLNDRGVSMAINSVVTKR